METPCFIDFEASSLSIYSYPTEVAWSNPDGRIEEHLINPGHVRGWTDWDPAAQGITGISRELLHEEGKSPAWVCERMNTILEGRTLYSDAPSYDRMWLETLFEQSQDGPPLFVLGDMVPMMLDRTGLDERQIHRCLEAGKNKIGKSHRAAWDVQAHLAGWEQVAIWAGM